LESIYASLNYARSMGTSNNLVWIVYAVPDDVLGIHHVTAIAGDPQRNIEFYARLLGLRLVKRTVNFDDPNTYHLYYGDEVGHPGTILTFFPWPNAPPGRLGTGQLTVTSFAIPENSVQFWIDRLRQAKVEFSGPRDRFDETVLSFSDPEGLQLELVATTKAEGDLTWKSGPVPGQHGIRGFFGVTLSEESLNGTQDLLLKLGFRQKTHQESRHRYEVGDGSAGKIVDVLHLPSLPRGQIAVGTVHHVAWRTPNDDEQKEWRSRLIDAGLNVTPVIDRQYFHSIYFRESGGVLFEIATDPPGFAVDELPAELGTNLMLPPWLESMRENIEQSLPPIQ
jgi:catechol 2,3-dioxygenase-like lactoylglutathione lyase family enzyme